MKNTLRRMLLFALIGLALPLFAALPEVLVGGTAPTAAPLTRSSPSVASDGNDFFVLWSDSRSGTGGLIGTRVQRDGRILDPLGLRLVTTDAFVLAPQVTWDGGAYLVVWTQTGGFNPYYDGWYERDIWAARVDRDGGFVMAPRVVVEDAETIEGHYLASNGSVSVIVHLNEGSSTYGPAKITALDRNGNTLHTEVLAGTSESKRDFAITAATSRFYLAWSRNNSYGTQPDNVQVAALTSGGHLITGNGLTFTGTRPAIGTDGSRFTVVWRTVDNQQLTTFSRTFNQNFTPVHDVQPLFTGVYTDYPSLCWIGNRYELLATRYWPGAIVSVTLDANGSPLDTRTRGTLPNAAFLSELFAATNGTDVLVANSTYGSSGSYIPGSQIIARVYPGNATESEPAQLLSWSGNTHNSPHVTSSASGQIIAWSEDEGAYATRVDTNGNSLDGRGIRLSTRAGRVKTGFDGTNYVVAWNDDRFIGVRSIAPLTGATVAEVHIDTPAHDGLALAVSHDATYVVYNEERIRVVRIPHATHVADPAPLDVSPLETSIDYGVAHPDASWNGSTLLVTWTREYHERRADPPLTFSTHVVAARMTANLSLMDPAPITVAGSASDDPDWWDGFGSPSVASNGEDWLVVMDSNRKSVLARRVLHDGTVEGNEPTQIAQGTQPVVAFDGARYALAWKEGPDNVIDRTIVLGAVPASGPVGTIRRTPLLTTRTQSFPAIAGAGNGETAIVYTKVSFRPEHNGVERSFLRVMDFGGMPRGRVVRR